VVPEEDVRDLGGQFPNQALDARIGRILHEGRGTSICQIANEAEIPAATV
jgi:hypothetical protein